ncbi:MAG: integral membrane sensor signal transduction histidine kinase [Nitrospirae bacterium]|nr:MAG: integral membrane sensor signal transduction histidine kinase [Nitrospirota bacterium]
MSLKKKIILSFLVSSVIIAILAISSYINFVEIRKEIRYLELSDTIRSKSLQLRRHEKNFFLYGDIKELENVYDYIRQLKDILRQNRPLYNSGKLLSLENKVGEYTQRFNQIELIFWEFHREFDKVKPSYKQYAVFSQLIESTILERPLANAEVLEKSFFLKRGSPVIESLKKLSTEILALRKDGEEILTLSKDLDKSAREKVERVISLSQTAVLVLIPLFLFVGLSTLFFIGHSIVRRLKLLAGAIEKTGRGDFSSLVIPAEEDEVGVLVNTFNKMEQDLIARDAELGRKNEELLQGKKLASIGTLASGVAHELNNPLNNIYLSAQVLSKEIDEETCLPIVRETVKDIFSQTLRVKRIVGDLLEFAREKPPDLKKVNIVSVINEVLKQMSASGELYNSKYDIDAPEEMEILADRHLMEQVFINLFTNAVDAMDRSGLLHIRVNAADTSVQIKVSDTGKGILSKDITRIFDPFFTTKEKGTGLGLAIVYSIIKKHNGKIEADSEPYKGTAFTITLPR